MSAGRRSWLRRGLLLAAVGALGFWLGTLYGRSAPAPVLGPGTKVARTSTVLLAVQRLARLETVRYHMEQVVDLKNRQQHLFGLIQADDAILLVAAGDVVAGLDLEDAQSIDLKVEPDAGRATLTLPAARVLSARLDNERTYVQRRTTDLLARRFESTETQARQQAERAIHDAALRAGILDDAERSAARTLEGLLETFGYREVKVRFRSGAR